MKKIFTYLAVLLSVFSFNTNAESTEPLFSQSGSFLLAKAVKLGRGSSVSTLDGSKFVGSRIKTPECSENCLNCNSLTGKCDTCESGYYLSSAGNCLPCSVSDCAECDAMGYCAVCEDGYSLENGECIAETPDSCSTNYYYSETEIFLNSRCIPCGKTYGPCSECNATQCTKCVDGYLMVNNSCISYQGACKQLGWTSYVTGTSNTLSQATHEWTETNCTVTSSVNTSSSFKINDSTLGVCIKCPIASATDRCGKYPNCNSGCWYGPSKNTCMSCPSNAKSCSKSTVECADGYILMGGYVCAACGSGCKTCINASDPYGCLSCLNGKPPKSSTGEYKTPGKCT